MPGRARPGTTDLESLTAENVPLFNRGLDRKKKTKIELEHFALAEIGMGDMLWMFPGCLLPCQILAELKPELKAQISLRTAEDVKPNPSGRRNSLA